MAPRTTPERLTALETKLDMFLSAQNQKDMQNREDVKGINTKLEGITKYISEDAGKNKTQARLWGFGAGALSGILAHLLSGGNAS